jgi:hypothetical protein
MGASSIHEPGGGVGAWVGDAAGAKDSAADLITASACDGVSAEIPAPPQALSAIRASNERSRRTMSSPPGFRVMLGFDGTVVG